MRRCMHRPRTGISLRRLREAMVGSHCGFAADGKPALAAPPAVRVVLINRRS